MLGYVRFRHDAIGDFGRVERQQKVINVIRRTINVAFRRFRSCLN